jgi:integrase
MPVRKHGDNWYVRLQVQGVRIERVAGPKKSDALDLEAQIRREATDQRVGRPSKKTLDQALLRWLQGDARALKSFDDIRAKARHIEKYIAGKPISQAPDIAEAIKKDMQDAGLDAITINRRLAVLRRICKLAAAWKWVDAAPKVTLLAGETVRKVALTEAQVDKLAAAAPQPYRDAILLVAYTGMRPGELLALQAHQVQGRAIVITESKTDRQRVIPVPRRAFPILKRIPLGITYAMMRKAFEDARAEAKMPHVQFRDLRRTYGSWIVQRTGNLKAAQDLLGHTTSVITAKHYAHLLTGHLEAAVATLDKPRKKAA